jgi:hypothetical protein
LACGAGLGSQETNTTTAITAAAAPVTAIAGRSDVATGSGGTRADGAVSVVNITPNVVFRGDQQS